MKIGSTNFSGNAKREWFNLKANEANLFRILPPLFSLADKGQFAKYYASHSIWFKSKPEEKNRPYHFQCIEKVNKETKLIEEHCPFCDQAVANKDQYEAGKAKGVPKDQLDAFNKAHVFPYQVDKKFYTNAVNTDNVVGLLPVGIKAFRALQDRLMDIRAQYQGLDATGMDGVFLNFKKTQKFKGDRDTVYTIDTATETANVNGQYQTTLKMHSLTDKFITYLEQSARDLGSLFKEITSEDMKALLSASDENKGILLERLFSRAEKHTQETTIGGTNSVSVNSITLGYNGVTLTSPEAQIMTPVLQSPTVPAASLTAQVLQINPTIAYATPPSAASFTLPGAPNAPQMPSGTISDDEFLKAFMSK